ncbi:hypothetical protein [Naasia sp. SYSU D00948]|uniref:hypothetical protein n=1 Tax=Naasia sp. SYSU D00948 TaxID=2817379 RepID=UPI001B311A6F|nr:hypothetical protein [Naasia sp. SYSU D00948]
MTDSATTVPDSARDYARRRLLARRNVPVIALVWVAVSGSSTAIWAFTGATGHFWPIWPMLGLGVAVVAAALSAYGPRVGYVTDDAVDREARRLVTRR